MRRRAGGGGRRGGPPPAAGSPPSASRRRARRVQVAALGGVAGAVAAGRSSSCSSSSSSVASAASARAPAPAAAAAPGSGGLALLLGDLLGSSLTVFLVLARTPPNGARARGTESVRQPAACSWPSSRSCSRLNWPAASTETSSLWAIQASVRPWRTHRRIWFSCERSEGCRRKISYGLGCRLNPVSGRSLGERRALCPAPRTGLDPIR